MSLSPENAAALPTAADVLGFWRGLGPQRWFVRDDAVDDEILTRFGPLREAAAAGALRDWTDDADSSFALILVLDQFPRNMFRDNAQAFATDAQARLAARRAVARGFDHAFENPERRFFYLPFMHSEALSDQDLCCDLCRKAGDDEGLRYAEIHAGIIRRFGRFPHRNRALGRETTPDEQDFLAAGGFDG